LTKLDEHINNEGVDEEVWMAYNNIIRTKTLIPIQCSFFASMHQLALKEAYTRRRQVRREDLSRSRKFTGQIKMWVLEIKDIDVRHSLGEDFSGNLSVTVRVSVEGQAKGTTKSSPNRSALDGSFEPLKINQDVDFYVKRPTSIIHMEVLHINDDMPEGSNARETLLGTVMTNLQPLESQRTVRQWCPFTVNGQVAGNVQLRMNYAFKEDVLSKWDPDSGLARSEENGGASFTIGFIGVGQIGQCALDAVLKSAHVPCRNVWISTRRPEMLASYEKLGCNVCFDNALVASKADCLFIGVQPNNLTQISSTLRGKIRQETLVVSLVAGVTGERVSQLLGTSYVFRTQIGGEWGLPEPDQKDLDLALSRAKLTPAEMAEPKRKQAALEAFQAKESVIIANVATALRALVPERGDLQKLIQSESRLALTMGLSEQSAMEVSQGAICNHVLEQRILGQHVMMGELPPGTKVRMIPTSSDAAEKMGVIQYKLKNREEYVVMVQGGQEVRSRRNRLFEEGGSTTEEGFSIDEYRELAKQEQWRRFVEFFTTTGEVALRGQLPLPEGGGGGEPSPTKQAKGRKGSITMTPTK